MGWAFCGEHEGREIGYGIKAVCDQEGCSAKIDRGLSFVCGTMHGGADGCGGYFCGRHLFNWVKGQARNGQNCTECSAELEREQEQLPTTKSEEAQ